MANHRFFKGGTHDFPLFWAGNLSLMFHTSLVLLSINAWKTRLGLISSAKMALCLSSSICSPSLCLSSCLIVGWLLLVGWTLLLLAGDLFFFVLLADAFVFLLLALVVADDLDLDLPEPSYSTVYLAVRLRLRCFVECLEDFTRSKSTFICLFCLSWSFCCLS